MREKQTQSVEGIHRTIVDGGCGQTTVHAQKTAGILSLLLLIYVPSDDFVADITADAACPWYLQMEYVTCLLRRTVTPSII